MLSELPSEIAAVLPSSPFAQLELANKIANYALAQKVELVHSVFSWIGPF